MFDQSLIESGKKRRQEGSFVTIVMSILLHLAALVTTVAAGYLVHQTPQAAKPIEAFLVGGGSPPPPPPPPPPPAASTSATPKVEKKEPEKVETPTDTFVTPQEIPKDLPEILPMDSEGAGVPGGVPGGVEGGVIGGVVGGVIGGVIGGELGGVLGGTLGGTGTGPLKVGGDVKPPVVLERVEPLYTEEARKARVQGVVILEAVVDEKGVVRNVKILKPLGMDLDKAAVTAVKQWKFKPGTKNGKPVPVVFNLTVSFRLQ